MEVHSKGSLVVQWALEGFQQCNWVLGGSWGVFEGVSKSNKMGSNHSCWAYQGFL